MIWSELELRWVLLGLGLLVILAVFLGGVIKGRSRASESPRSEPEIWPEEPGAASPVAESPEFEEGLTATIETAGESPGDAEHDIPFPVDADEQPAESPETSGTAHSAADAGRVVSLRLIPREGEHLDAERTVRALREAGLQHGPYEIFHYCVDRNAPESGFSVANLVEPGTFDLSSVAGSQLPGMTFFLILPGSRDPVERFDRMVGIARELCQSLDAQLRDELGDAWTIQSERYLREELIEYRRRQSGI